MKCKMEAEKEKAAIEKYCFLMFLFEKKASNAITNKEFELFKNTWAVIHYNIYYYLYLF